MGAAPVTLDQGPPLPPQLAPQPQATMQGLAGPQQAAQSGSASLQAQVIQKLMFCEQTLNDIATMMPAAAGPVNAIIDQMRKGMGAVLAQGATPPPAQGPPMGGLMMSPSGGMGAQPTS